MQILNDMKLQIKGFAYVYKAAGTMDLFVGMQGK